MKRILFTLACSLGLIQARTHVSGHNKTGIDFFIVGDYGCIINMTEAYYTFGMMSSIVGNASVAENPDPRDLVDFFVTVGDNIYPTIGDSPTDEEFDIMLSLFQYPYLENLPVYAVRGNHDAVFAWDRELKLSEVYDKWYMPSLYYKQEIEVGNGKRFGFLFIDSNLVLCSDYQYAADSSVGLYSMNLGEELLILRDTVCTSQEQVEWGNLQYEWIKQTMEEWEKDESIIWKATVQHHPVWGKWYVDYEHIVDNYLPLLMGNKFDFYFCGHEHVIAHALYPYSQTDFDHLNYLKDIKGQQMKAHQNLQAFDCEHNITLHFGNNPTYASYKKGEAIHQITTGTTGYDLYALCPALPSMGRFKYAENEVHAFTQVHADDNVVNIRIRGVNLTTNELIELYQIDVVIDDDKQQVLF